MSCWVRTNVSTDASAPQLATISRHRSTSASSEAGVAEGALQCRPFHRRRQVEGAQHEHGALAFAQIRCAALAGDGGVAEQAEHVVAHLEGHANGVAIGGESTCRCRVVHAGEGMPDGQRASDRVTPGLQQRHPSSGRVVGGIEAIQAQVEVLPGHDLHSQRRERSPGALQHVDRQRSAIDEIVGPHEGEIAGEDRRARAVPLGIPRQPPVVMHAGESALRCRPAAATMRAVHHVVVEQGEGVQHLHGGGDVEHAGILGPAGSAMAPVDERRAQALAAGGDQPGDLRGDVTQARVEGDELGHLLGEVVGEDQLDRVLDGVQRVACPSVDQRGHGIDGCIQAGVVEPREPVARCGLQRVQLGDLTDRPRAERPRLAASTRPQCIPLDPLGIADLGRVQRQFPVELADDDRADLVLDDAVVHHRAVREVGDGEADVPRGRAKLLTQATADGGAE